MSNARASDHDAYVRDMLLRSIAAWAVGSRNAESARLDGTTRGIFEPPWA